MREGVGRLVPRPLDRLRSIKTKLGVLVAATVTAAAFLTWIGLYHHLGPTRTFPLAIVGALVLTQVLARGMTSPLREMTAAARAMARGDYSRRVRATSRDEVGQLAEAFNSMADDLASEDRLRREMVANVSHELRTPVAALRAQLENMVDGVVPADAATLGAALAQTERLGELVTYLLDLSRLEAGAVGLDLADLAVRELVDDVVQEVAGATRAAGRDVRWRVQVTPPDLRVRADAARLSQVLANLLHNAARHTPPGSEVTVRAGLGARRQEVVLDVVDQGAGVPAAERERIFGRFQRGTTTGTGPATGGTGLGLAIARWAVSLHGGTIAVADSAPGEGATIRVRLPARGPRADRQG
ncbi:HAMP domain-containing sensor histidine kinase [Georgenia thermotolerans]|uniref:Signal transduction histidine-protein kinase/phosphatase MprB n=1 Tax=Georgenia thermotolerans TaxID=527326 RepID=A0A7J5UKG9_9MICO|nr:HAMP domain-containing sensor histidine kinase [Georgenia thermotolerans]KAE8762363.1 HAMP domain-containing protein [Georgenia thermotolerans]